MVYPQGQGVRILDVLMTKKGLTMASAYPELGLFIDNRLRPGRGEGDRTVVNPASGEALARLPIASRDDLDDALASGRARRSSAGARLRRWSARTSCARRPTSSGHASTTSPAS